VIWRVNGSGTGTVVDAAGFELAVNGVELELVEVQLLADIVQLRLRHAAALVGSVEQHTQVIAQKHSVCGHAKWV